jgi:hypothetical protein
MTTIRNESEKAAIEAALAFVNLRKIFDPERVYAIFGTTNRLKESGEQAAEILENDRRDCEDRLAAIVADVRAARRKDGHYVRRHLLPKVVLVGRADADPRGRVILRLSAPTGVEAGYAYALALLHDPTREWGAALRRCKHEPCNAFFLAFPSAEGGPTPKYCCPEHQKAADAANAAERVARYRARLKRAKQVPTGRRSRTGKTKE